MTRRGPIPGPVSVYALLDPETGKPRHVGQSENERVTPLDLACPRCRAVHGEPCASPRAKARVHGHAPRVDQANAENTRRHVAAWNARYANCDELNQPLGVTP